MEALVVKRPFAFRHPSGCCRRGCRESLDAPPIARAPWDAAARIILVALAYIATATLGFLVAMPPGNITPFLALAAIRFGQREVTAASLLVSGIAIWGTTRGYGPFHREAVHESLLLLQVFVGVVTMTSLALAAVETERRHAEAEVLDLNVTLERRVAERTAELEEKSKQLEAFSYSVSHDLKAPLRGIEGYARLLEEDHADRLDDEGRTFVKTIRWAADQMHRLIDDLLSYSRLERRALVLERIDPADLVRALVADRSDEIQARGVVLRVDVSCASISVDREGLTKALRNLLDDALKFTRSVDRMARKAMQRMGGRAWAESTPGAGAAFHLGMPR